MSITLYSKNACPQCDATKRVFDKKGLEYTVVRLEDSPEAVEMFKSKGFLAAPVVLAGDHEWSGFRPDKISEVAALVSA